MTVPELRSRENGRILGPRAATRRAGLLDALRKHLETTAWHRASIIEVARSAGVSAATFYGFWPDLETAVRDLIADLHAREIPLGDHLEWIEEFLDREAWLGLGPKGPAR